MDAAGPATGSSRRTRRGGTASDTNLNADVTRHTRRFSMPKIRDVRWVIGLLLLVGGVLGTVKVIASFDETRTAWVPVRTLVPGQTIEPNDVRAVRVRLDSSEQRYLLGTTPPSGVLQRAVGAGELLARSSVGPASSLALRTVTVQLEAGNSSAIRDGSTVEMWVARKVQDAGTDRYDKPVKTTDRAVVAQVGNPAGGVVTVNNGQPVQLLVPSERLADVIDAVNSKARITLVPLINEVTR